MDSLLPLEVDLAVHLPDPTEALPTFIQDGFDSPFPDFQTEP